MTSEREGKGRFDFPNRWGGRRRGAGRKPKGSRAGVSHGRKAPLSKRFPVHVTLRIEEGLPSLRRKGEYAVLQGAFASGRERFGFRLIHFVVLSNHLHLMTEAKDRRAHTRGMQGLAIRIAKRLNKHWGRKGRVFADRFHGRELKSPREVRTALRYLLHNARRHRVALAPSGPDPYSSGRWFDGWRGIAPDRLFAAPLARARTWLLQAGWRRHGLIEPTWEGP